MIKRQRNGGRAATECEVRAEGSSMTNVKAVGAAAKASASVKSGASHKEADEMGETYMFHEETTKETMNDLDDFEARLNGQKPAGRKSAASHALKPVPTSNVPPMFVPKVHKPVKPTSMSEEQEDALEAIKAVSELDRFEQRLNKQ